jgi:AraC-like DNA-binding protein
MNNKPTLGHSGSPNHNHNSRRERKKRDNRERRREQIADMLLRGETYRTIGKAVGISVETVSKEISQIRQRWHRQTTEQTNELMGQFLQQLELIKSEAMREWDRSKQPKVKVVKKYCELLENPGAAPSAPSAPSATGGLSGNADPLASGEEVYSGDDAERYPENPFSHTEGWGFGGNGDGDNDDGYDDDSDDESGYRNPFGDEPVEPESSSERGGSSGKPKKQKPGKSDNLLLAAEVTQTVEERLGDPRFLVVVQSCIEKQATMLGMNVKKVALTDPTGQKTYAAGAVQELMVLAEEVAQGPLVYDDSIIELEANKYLIANADSASGEGNGLASGEGNQGGESGESGESGDGNQGHEEWHEEGHVEGRESGEALSFPLANQLPIPAVVVPAIPVNLPAKKPASFSLFDSPSQPDQSRPNSSQDSTESQ